MNCVIQNVDNNCYKLQLVYNIIKVIRSREFEL